MGKTPLIKGCREDAKLPVVHHEVHDVALQWTQKSPLHKTVQRAIGLSGTSQMGDRFTMGLYACQVVYM
jgi:hypothetical protein